jgi:hypothetical protein
VFFLDREGVELAVEGVFPLGQALIVGLEFIAGRLVLPLKLLFQFDLQLAG